MEQGNILLAQSQNASIPTMEKGTVKQSEPEVVDVVVDEGEKDLSADQAKTVGKNSKREASDKTEPKSWFGKFWKGDDV